MFAAGLGSTALVLSIAAPFGGSYWYGLTLLSPLAGAYYWNRGSREEQFAVGCVDAAHRMACIVHTVLLCWWLTTVGAKLLQHLQVKMVTADDDSTTDIVVEGDTEEVTRMSKELQLVEKGKVYVKGILEN